MRLYGMYYVCKSYLEKVNEMQIGSRAAGNTTVRYIDGWKEKNIILNELYKIAPLKGTVKKMYETIPVVFRDDNKFDITQSTADSFIRERKTLITEMETIINLYESIGYEQNDETTIGFDVKMPDIDDFENFSKCVDDLNFIITQCPFLVKKDGNVKFNSVDVGSMWLTFVIGGAAATTILMNLGKIVDYAVKIKSHMENVKIQKELLRSAEIKNDLANQMANAFEETTKILIHNCVEELEKEIEPLANGEEKGKAEKSIEKLGKWMDRGMQIYSAIDAPKEAQNIFPEQSEMINLPDDLIKLLEMKEK